MKLLPTLAAMLLAVSGLAHAQGGPAVDGYNGNLSSFGGFTDQPGLNDDDGGRSLGVFDGNFLVPLGNRFGSQIDYAAGNVDGFLFLGAGGHLFLRDPNIGLIGLIGHWAQLRGANVHRVGFEGEYYMGLWTFYGNVGWQWGNDSRRGLLTVPEGAFAKATILFYPTGDLALRAGLGLSPIPGREYHLKFIGGAEWQFWRKRVPGLTGFVRGTAGTSDRYLVIAGLRWYFRLSGEKDKSLRQRHRQDGTRSLNPSSLFDGFAKGKPPPKKKDPGCPPGEVFLSGECQPLG